MASPRFSPFLEPGQSARLCAKLADRAQPLDLPNANGPPRGPVSLCGVRGADRNRTDDGGFALSPSFCGPLATFPKSLALG